jgi:hypothetical protein
MSRRILIGPFVMCLVMLTIAVPHVAQAAPITDLGTGPPIPMSNLYLATAQALANAAHNATAAQQNATITAQTATIMGVTTLYALDTATEGTAIAKILD